MNETRILKDAVLADFEAAYEAAEQPFEQLRQQESALLFEAEDMRRVLADVEVALKSS